MNGYVVHYRDDNTGIEKSIAAASSSTSDITDLTRDHSYTLKVEAISEHLSGISDSATVTVGKHVYLCQKLYREIHALLKHKQ